MTLDQIEAAIRTQARVTATRILLDERVTEVLISEPHRITRAVYGLAVSAVWPPRQGMTIADVLCECGEKIGHQVAFAKAGLWGYVDQPGLIALRQAENALLRMILDE